MPMTISQDSIFLFSWEFTTLLNKASSLINELIVVTGGQTYIVLEAVTESDTGIANLFSDKPNVLGLFFVLSDDTIQDHVFLMFYKIK